MNKDIPFEPVEGVYLAITKRIDNIEKSEEDFWDAHIINDNPYPIENVLITSQGYGKAEGKELETTTFRHMIERIESKSTAHIEAVDPNTFKITNQFWVSYYRGRQIFDKKFIFMPGSFLTENVTYIPQLDKEGVLHK
jgi:hypothetical protein